MAIYELTKDALRALPKTTFGAVNIREREDLQRMLRAQIDVISPDTLIIAEEFSQWEDANRRIDLLGVDRQGNLVVIELKRTESGGHMELQALRYAAMVSAMTFDRAVSLYAKMLADQGKEGDADTLLREFLDLDDADEPVEDRFAQDVRIVLASAEFSKELTTCVIWLNERGLDIRCVRLRPYLDEGRVFVDVQQVIPLPEAEQYQVQLRAKAQKERASRQSSREFTKFAVTVGGKRMENLTKRRAVFELIRYLCAHGVMPAHIMDRVTFRKINSFRWVDGEVVREDEFIERATQDGEANNRRFDAWRFFTADDELIRADGKTYSVSNQWGSRAMKWMAQVIEAFPAHDVKVEETGT